MVILWACWWWKCLLWTLCSFFISRPWDSLHLWVTRWVSFIPWFEIWFLHGLTFVFIFLFSFTFLLVYGWADCEACFLNSYLAEEVNFSMMIQKEGQSFPTHLRISPRCKNDNIVGRVSTCKNFNHIAILAHPIPPVYSKLNALDDFPPILPSQTTALSQSHLNMSPLSAWS